MSLDCTTPKGRGYIAAQNDCLKRLEGEWGVQIFPTAGDETADVDAIAIKNGLICGVMEVKVREMDLAQLKRFGSYLITFEKLIKLRDVAVSLCVPGLIVVLLLKDNLVVYWKICDERGNFLTPIEARTTQTQATCNGGQADRYNAFLSLDGMSSVSLTV